MERSIKKHVKVGVILLILSTINSGIWWFWFKQYGLNLEEHSFIENFQAVQIAFAGLIFLISAFQQSGFVRIFFINLMWFCASFFFREVTLSDFNVHPIIAWWTEGTGLNIMMASIWSSFTLFYLFNFKKFTQTLMHWLKSTAGFSIIFCGVCLVLSLPFDKQIFDIPFIVSRFWEETIEVSAFIGLIASAILCLNYEKLRL